jgi:hypothetical protein
MIGVESFDAKQNDFTPIVGMVAVTPSDSTPLQYQGQPTPCRGLLFQNVSGNVAAVMADGSTVTFNVTTSWFGVQYLRVAYIKATGTSYTGNIHACY